MKNQPGRNNHGIDTSSLY